ncbi:AAA ATPase-like protein [Prauserella shujinwangii]|uniref:AAA ATPase-like protein n=1 Tax=Prauserella shujinwangii TaxID=1453103 RepID=A0A2T0M3W4_9PSEU|nr:AAA family ATPase [Prauserella shujinwangii]PRX51445.1 AAA ATPase-like protein [Prauserella shujinwangii]
MLIGREHPLGVLRDAVTGVFAGHGGFVLVTGESGIGKTALVTEAAGQARARGATVVGGACCDADVVPAFWPWVQLVRALRDTDGFDLPTVLGERAGTAVDDTFRRHDAVVRLLTGAARGRPVMAVLDDLQLADVASVRLLDFVVRHTRLERVLVVGTYRDSEVQRRGHRLRAAMLPLVARATTVALTGLDVSGVARLAARTSGEDLDPGTAADLHRHTGGNPFFVEQIARLGHGAGVPAALPPELRESVRQRLAQLSEPARTLLGTAAVLGSRFAVPLLEAVTGLARPDVDELLAEAMLARLITRDGDTASFPHGLVHTTLYDSLDPAERRRRHAAVVRVAGADPDLAATVFATDLARHAWLAEDEVPARRAVDLLVDAARQASARMAGDEAVRLLHWAADRCEPGRRLQLIRLRLAEAQHACGEKSVAWRMFDGAVLAAEDERDPLLLARVALTVPHTDPERAGYVLDLLRRAHRELVGEPPPDAGLEELVREVTVRAVVLARDRRDDDTLGFTLQALHAVLWGPGTAARRQVLTEEMAAVARRTGDQDLDLFASALRWVALLEQGDPGYLAQLESFAAAAEASGLPRWVGAATVDRSTAALLRGRFAEAAELADRVPAEHLDEDPELARMFAWQRRWALLDLQGRLGEIVDERANVPGSWLLADVLVGIAALDRGDVETALRCHRDVLAAGAVPGEWRSLWLRFRAQIAVATQDADLRERTRALLTPHAGEWLVSLFGCDISGPVDHWLAVLDTAAGDTDSAIRRFHAAAASADSLRAHGWSVLARAGLVEVSAAGPDEAEAVARTADRLGMPHVAERMRLRCGQNGAGDHGADEAGTGREFRRRGDVWAVRFAGRQEHLADTKGLHDLRQLLANPGAAIPATWLVAGDARPAASSGGDRIIDATAKVRFKRHLDSLDRRIEDALAAGRDDTAARLDRERQDVVHHLRAATGLCGRDRRLGDTAERARKTVAARIRTALRKLDERHPPLAAHLRATVETGTTCRYEPADAEPWHV